MQVGFRPAGECPSVDEDTFKDPYYKKEEFTHYTFCLTDSRCAVPLVLKVNICNGLNLQVCNFLSLSHNQPTHARTLYTSE